VPVRASSYTKTALKDYQAVLDAVKPLAAMTEAERDQAWVKICSEIEKAINSSREFLSFGSFVSDSFGSFLTLFAKGDFLRGC
jgi:hypothetical protein